VLVGSQSTVEFGLRGRNVALGERVSVENDIEAGATAGSTRGVPSTATSSSARTRTSASG